MAPQTGLLRAQLAEATGCNLETIRYYEKVELLPSPPRAANGYRIYPADLVRRLRFILRARELGFSMEEIRSLLSMMDAGAQTCAEVKARTERHLVHVRRKIDDLQRIAEILSRTAEQCSGGDAPDCPIIDVMMEHQK